MIIDKYLESGMGDVMAFLSYEKLTLLLVVLVVDLDVYEVNWGRLR